MKQYEVTLPIAGHAYLTVEADSPGEAIEQAMADVTQSDIDHWEALEQFHKGNICYCPSPWKAEATAVDDGEDTDE